MTTKEQLEAENARLRELTAALIGMLTVIADADPPMPADGGDLRKYDMECARRLQAITVWAEPSTEMPEGLTAATITGRTEAICKSLARPLRYEPERQGENNGTAPEKSRS